MLPRLTHTVITGVIRGTFVIVSAAAASIYAGTLLAALPLRTIVIDGAAPRIRDALTVSTDLADGAVVNVQGGA